MSWTVTYDASPEAKVKATGSHAVNRDRHLGRAADLAAGFDFGHQNPNIDPVRMALNESFVNDGNGGFRELAVTQGLRGKDRPPSAEFADYRHTRLEQVKKPLRKDAVIMRGVMLQLDPKWFDAHCPDWRIDGLNDQAQRFVQAQLDWACQEFGQQNIVGGSVDLDETSPHLQLSVVPVTDDGRLSQKDFFQGPGHFRKQRKELCDALEAAGYEPQRTATARSTERTSSAEYARTADKARATLAVAQRDSRKLWEERQQVRATKAKLDEDAESLTNDRQELDAQLGDVPRLMHKAKKDGMEAARSAARQETEEARSAARAAKVRAEEAERAHRAAERDLLALREEIHQQLLNIPEPPTYEEMRQDILGAQPHLLRKFLRGMKFKDGSTLEQKFEDFQRRSFTTHRLRDSDALGRYVGPSYERWKDRSLELQRKIDTARFSNQASGMNYQHEGPEDGTPTTAGKDGGSRVL